MITLKRVKMTIETIVSDGVQDEYTRIMSSWVNLKYGFSVEITQITYTDHLGDKFYGKFFINGWQQFYTRDEDLLGEYLYGVGAKLGSFSKTDKFTLTEKGERLLSCIPYLFPSPTNEVN
jgi:hypothetical protein